MKNRGSLANIIAVRMIHNNNYPYERDYPNIEIDMLLWAHENNYWTIIVKMYYWYNIFFCIEN